MKVKFFANQNQFRKWLEDNHDSADELVVGYYKVATGKPSMTWSQSVDQALCFGWIDGIRHKIDEESYSIRFTPRRPKSNWSAVNIKKVAALKKKDLMHPAGLAAFGKRTESRSEVYGYENNTELSEPFRKKFARSKKAWAYFESQSPSCRRKLCHWVMSAKQEATQIRRLEKLIASCKAEEKLY